MCVDSVLDPSPVHSKVTCGGMDDSFQRFPSGVWGKIPKDGFMHSFSTGGIELCSFSCFLLLPVDLFLLKDVLKV